MPAGFVKGLVKVQKGLPSRLTGAVTVNIAAKLRVTVTVTGRPKATGEVGVIERLSAH